MVRQHRFLVADAGPEGALIEAIVQPFGLVAVARSAAEACALLRASGDWTGLIVGADLRDGLDVVAFARDRKVQARTVLIARGPAPEVVNRAFALGAGVLCRPVPTGELARFAREAVGPPVRDGNPLEHAVVRWSTEFRLTRREAAILHEVLKGTSRDTLAQVFGVSENTIKTHVRALLRKVDALSLRELAADMLRWIQAEQLA